MYATAPQGARWACSALFLAATLTGCPSNDNGDDNNDPPPPEATGDTGGVDDTAVAPVPVLLRPSKSSTISISDNDEWVAMVTSTDDSLAIFRTSDNIRLAKVTTGKEPSAVVIHPDGVTAFVANRADATVVRVDGINTGDPIVGNPVPVGSEPTGVALSPTGALLFVAEYAEGRISVIDTASMAVVGVIDEPLHPRGLAVTNDGDDDDSDELIVVPEFFGEALAEVSDVGRLGRVRLYSVADYSSQGTIQLSPLDSGFGVSTAPNQLYNVAIAGSKLFLPSVAASPEPPVVFNQNVQPVVFVANLASLSEDQSLVGTQNLARFVRDEIPEGDPRFFLADIVDIAMVGEDIAYVLSRGTNVVQRVAYNAALGIEFGSAFNKQIEIGAPPPGAPDGCDIPTGIVTSNTTQMAYVACLASRRLGVIDLTIQEQITTVEATNPLINPVDIEVNEGLKFFHTGRARWSSEGWSSCASCHPDGLADGITWSFAAGPRQTVPMDGSFSKGPGPQEQRVLNWTGIFDEIHDFERNTRDVSGGLGAVTQSEACGNLEFEFPSELDGGLGFPVKQVQDTQEFNCTVDWDKIEAWAKTIRPPKALQTTDPGAVAAGRQHFIDGGCDRCHSGPAFTVSQVAFEPDAFTNAALTVTPFPPFGLPAGFPSSWNEHTVQIDVEPQTGFGPPQVACGIRNVASFGVPGNDLLTDALERRADNNVAQGQKGFNVPSLYGTALSAPYLHHGQATTLTELFTDPRWAGHLRAGNPVFSPDAEDVDELVAYLLAIDADSPELPTPADFDLCVEPDLTPIPF